LAAAAVLLRPSGFRVVNIDQLTGGADLSGSPNLSADGKWLAYMSDRVEPGNLDIWLQQMPSGAPRRLTTHPSEDSDPSVSPAGDRLVFRSERNGGGIYMVNSDGSGERLLVPSGRHPRYSPDGSEIVYWIGERDPGLPSAESYVIRPDGSGRRRIAADFADARNPIWSGDGRLILFEGCRNTPPPMTSCVDWWTVNASRNDPLQSGAMPLLRAHAVERQSSPEAWLDGRVLISARHGALITLWEIEVPFDSRKARGTPQQVTTSGTHERASTLAANGRIAFGRVFSGLHLWRVKPAPGRGEAETSRITGDLGTDGCPYLSGDGNILFFSRRLGDERNIVARRLATGEESVVVHSGEDSFWPVSDATGSRVVFESRGNGTVSLQLLNKDRTVKQLCSGCAAPSSWFAENEVLYSGAGDNIYRLDTVTGQSRTMLRVEPGTRVGNADWSRQTRMVLFTRRLRGQPNAVFAVAAKNSDTNPEDQWIPVVSEKETPERPRWSGDGRSVFYISKRDGFDCIWAQDFDPQRMTATGEPYAVQHYHNNRITPGRTNADVLALAVSGREIILDVGEVTETIWTGMLKAPGWRLLF
jgi:Tol biopolymer transport system component